MKWLWRHVPLTSWRSWRRWTQVAFLLLFLWLFRRTEDSGGGMVSGWEGLFFRMDPLVAGGAMLAAKAFLWVMWPALILLALTAVLGRFFCGWICPLGTLLDGFHWMISPVARWANRINRGWVRSLRGVRYALLIVVLLGAAMALPVVGWLDPLALLTRGLAFWVDPAINRGASDGSLWLLDHGPEWVSRYSEPTYGFLRENALPFAQKAYLLAAVAAGMLGAVFLLELVARRFWCKYVCPLGAMLGVAGRWARIQRVPSRVCGTCKAKADCGQSCRMDAFDGDRKLVREDCTLCMDCVSACPTGLARFRKAPKAAPAAVQLSRRAFVGSMAAGVAVPAVAYALRLPKGSGPGATMLRPPGSGGEADFLNQCIRCGECLKVCPTNALQPVWFEAGVNGLFSPKIVPRMGYCEYNCTLCGQVCPTGAIAKLGESQKHGMVIGKAVFDTDRCLPWAKNEECLCCEEHCPVPDKAIRFDEVEVVNAEGETVLMKRPYVCFEACIGCGICENKCPLDGPAAIQVRRAEMVRHVPGQHRQHRGRVEKSLRGGDDAGGDYGYGN